MANLPDADKQTLDTAFEKMLRATGLRANVFSWTLSSLIDQGTDSSPTFGTVTADSLLLNTAATSPTVGTSAALSSGTVTIVAPAVVAGSKIFLSRAVSGGTHGSLCVGVITAGVGFTITSNNNSDTSTINWAILA